MTDAASVLWRIVALSDHHPAGTCWAWMDGPEKVCGRAEDPTTFHLCARHAKVARRRAEKDHAKRVAQDARIRAQVEAEAPARAAKLAKLDARIARLTGGGSTDPAVVNLPLAKRIPSDARIAEVARLLRLRESL